MLEPWSLFLMEDHLVWSKAISIQNTEDLRFYPKVYYIYILLSSSKIKPITLHYVNL